MGLLAMNPFICLAEGTNICFDVLHEVVNHPLLVVTGVETDRAQFAYFGQGPVQ
jgi:hypothetical protein